MNKIVKYLALAVYYSVLRFLPRSSFPIVGKTSKKLRYLCCSIIFKKCGINVNIERLAFFGSGFNIEIGDNSGLGRNCVVQSDIKIGNSVLIGPNFYILSRNHAFEDASVTIKEQKYHPKLQTIIEDDVWIGRDVLFTPGRYIKKGIVIGARAVVTKDFDQYSVIGGNPAKLIKLRVKN